MSRRIIFLHDWLLGFRGGEKVLDALLLKYTLCDNSQSEAKNQNANKKKSSKSSNFQEVTTLTRVCQVVTLFYRPNKTSTLIDRSLSITSIVNCLPFLSYYYRYLLPFFPFLVKLLRLRTLDPQGESLIISTCHALIKGVPKVKPEQLHICYCFTPTRYAHDMQGEYITERDGLKRFILNWIKKADVEASENVDYFIAISEFVRDRIRRCYPDYIGEIPVVYPPVKTDIPRLGLARGDFYLFASALVPYKNPQVAIEACLGLGRELVVIGSGPLKRMLVKKFGDRVKFLGRVDDEALYRYLQTAKALLFPVIEDFGILPVEAMACGLPVIAPNVGGAAETVYYDPNDIGHSSGILYNIGNDHVASLQAIMKKFDTISLDEERIKERARLFDYDNFYKNWSAVLAKIAETDERVRPALLNL